MAALDRKLIRDVIHLRGQVVAITLVVACGVASFVAMRSTYQSLLSSQQTYYESYRFADVFAQLKRAPDAVATDITTIPGVAKAEFRVVADVTLDVPGLEEPAKGKNHLDSGTSCADAKRSLPSGREIRRSRPAR